MEGRARGLPAVRPPARRLGCRRRAGILVLEEENHARKRGDKIYGELLGGGSGCDAMPGGGLDPEGSGTEVAISSASKKPASSRQMWLM